MWKGGGVMYYHLFVGWIGTLLGDDRLLHANCMIDTFGPSFLEHILHCWLRATNGGTVDGHEFNYLNVFNKKRGETGKVVIRPFVCLFFPSS